jgi:homoserine O-acetyltransferase
MSDLVNILIKKGAKRFDPPTSPNSVGWTEPLRVRLADEKNPLRLDCGKIIAPVDVEYEVYGELNAARSNAVLVLHALSGDAHAAGWSTGADGLGRPWLKNRPGWWDEMIGPGKGIDTKKYFVICSNILGGCYGTTGPASICPATNRPYGLNFPVVTVGDWVRLQERLISYLGIKRLLGVVGGSLGGQQALEWALAYPELVENALIIASSARLSDQGLAFNAIARHAITTDPNFRNGNYYEASSPDQGLAVARMLGHITYLSEASMHSKFGRRFCNGDGPGYHLGVDFEVEGYLQHQGEAFVERFDANSYLYITRAMDYYDASAWGGGDLDKACERIKCRLLLVSFSSDWLYPVSQMKDLALALCRNRKQFGYVNIPSSYGHDAFLLETEKLSFLIRCFLEGEEYEQKREKAMGSRGYL